VRIADSVILIDHFNGIDRATGSIFEMQDRLALSVITRAEVLTGFEDKHHSTVKQLLDRFETLVRFAGLSREPEKCKKFKQRPNGAWTISSFCAPRRKMRYSDRQTSWRAFSHFPNSRHSGLDVCAP
jgi:hypothetical protein